MPENNEFGQFYPPELGGQIPEQSLPEQPAPEDDKSKWQWIGDSRRPEAQQSRDGISDIFTVDTDAERADVDDALGVNIDKDVMDADEDGSFDSLVEVTEEDVMGNPDLDPLRGEDDEDTSNVLYGGPDPTEERQPVRYQLTRRPRRPVSVYREQPGIGGLQGMRQ